MTMLSTPAHAGWISLDYGATDWPYSPDRPHRGRDWGWLYADPAGSKRVVAGVGGTITRVVGDGGWNGGWGNHVEITVVPGVVRRLCHLATGTIVVRPGQTVTAGTYVGTMGATGDTGGMVHLHEELWLNGVRTNPRPFYSTHLPGTEIAPAITPREDDTMSAAEVTQIKEHVTRLAAGTPGNGARLIRYARSANPAFPNNIWALYRNGAGAQFRVQVTGQANIDALRDAKTESSDWLGKWELWPDDGVQHRPGMPAGHARSDATGSTFALYVDDQGNRVRRLIPADQAPDAPTLPQRELWSYAEVNG